MRRFSLQCLCFLVPLLLAAGVWEYVLRQVPNPYQYKYEWMKTHAQEVETLIMGSSQTFYGVRPDCLDTKAFNLANVSQRPLHDLTLLRQFVTHCHHLNTVVMPISTFTWFEKRLEEGSEAYRCRYYDIYMHSRLYHLRPDSYLEISGLATAKAKTRRWLDNDTLPGCDTLGWGTEYALEKKDLAAWNDGSEAATSVARHTAPDWSRAEENYADLCSIASLCRQHHLRLVLISTPCSERYNRLFPAAQIVEMERLTTRYQQQFGLTYLDYRTDSRFTDDDFFDSNHLSDIGAEKFSRILCADLGQDGKR